MIVDHVTLGHTGRIDHGPRLSIFNHDHSIMVKIVDLQLITQDRRSWAPRSLIMTCGSWSGGRSTIMLSARNYGGT